MPVLWPQGFIAHTSLMFRQVHLTLKPGQQYHGAGSFLREKTSEVPISCLLCILLQQNSQESDKGGLYQGTLCLEDALCCLLRSEEQTT